MLPKRSASHKTNGNQIWRQICELAICVTIYEKVFNTSSSRLSQISRWKCCKESLEILMWCCDKWRQHSTFCALELKDIFRLQRSIKYCAFVYLDGETLKIFVDSRWVKFWNLILLNRWIRPHLKPKLFNHTKTIFLTSRETKINW